MTLCDIGNTHFHIFDVDKIHHIPVSETPTMLKDKKVYYISVNEVATEKLQLNSLETINLKAYVNIHSGYEGLGVDRAVACSAIDEGVVIDAGTAITVDIMHAGNHLGGYILPGLTAYKSLYAKISEVLKAELNFNIDLSAFPQNTKDAISYGILKPIELIIQDSAKQKNIYFTGGDGKFLAKFFPRAIYDEMLIFRGMKKIIKKENI